jgi:hypothetical protein
MLEIGMIVQFVAGAALFAFSHYVIHRQRIKLLRIQREKITYLKIKQAQQ